MRQFGYDIAQSAYKLAPTSMTPSEEQFAHVIRSRVMPDIESLSVDPVRIRLFDLFIEKILSSEYLFMEAGNATTDIVKAISAIFIGKFSDEELEKLMKEASIKSAYYIAPNCLGDRVDLTHVGDSLAFSLSTTANDQELFSLLPLDGLRTEMSLAQRATRAYYAFKSRFAKVLGDTVKDLEPGPEMVEGMMRPLPVDLYGMFDMCMEPYSYTLKRFHLNSQHAIMVFDGIDPSTVSGFVKAKLALTDPNAFLPNFNIGMHPGSDMSPGIHFGRDRTFGGGLFPAAISPMPDNRFSPPNDSTNL